MQFSDLSRYQLRVLRAVIQNYYRLHFSIWIFYTTNILVNSKFLSSNQTFPPQKLQIESFQNRKASHLAPMAKRGSKITKKKAHSRPSTIKEYRNES